MLFHMAGAALEQPNGRCDRYAVHDLRVRLSMAGGVGLHFYCCIHLRCPARPVANVRGAFEPQSAVGTYGYARYAGTVSLRSSSIRSRHDAQDGQGNDEESVHGRRMDGLTRLVCRAPPPPSVRETLA